MSAVFFVLVLVMCGNCGGRLPPIDPRAGDVWPLRGIQYCRKIIHVPTKESCIGCFQDSGNDWIQASECVGEWLPPRFAKCSELVNPGNNGNGAQESFEACLNKANNKQNRENKRAEFLYTKGGKYLSTVGDSNIVVGGPAAIFSCLAQESLLQTKDLQNDLGDFSGSCFSRFQMDPVNAHWHLDKEDRPNQSRSQALPKTAGKIPESQLTKKRNTSRMNLPQERDLVYHYGYVGNDMPFHGIGPLAVDILKGECIFDSLYEAGDLDALVAAIWDSPSPVPAWIFREILNEISSITLPA